MFELKSIPNFSAFFRSSPIMPEAKKKKTVIWKNLKAPALYAVEMRAISCTMRISAAISARTTTTTCTGIPMPSWKQTTLKQIISCPESTANLLYRFITMLGQQTASEKFAHLEIIEVE